MRKDRRRSMLAVLVAFIVYAGVALLANLPDWPGDPNRIRTGDLDQMAWFLAWTPHAILHWQNPFATTWLNYPDGVNLAQNTSLPLLALLVAPLTLAVSPVASLNLLLWLAFPLSALSMFIVLRRWTGWSVAAFVGGALYGFSPYVVTQSLDHLNLAFVPLPPLILMCGYEVVRQGQRRPLPWGVALGAVVAAQFFVSSEVAATSMLVLVLSALVLAVANPRAIVPAWRRGARALAAAGAIVAIAIAYPAWMMIDGPFRYRGPAYRSGFSADLWSSIAPTKMQMFAPVRPVAGGSRLLFGNISENGAYLGLSLIVLLLVLLALCWRSRWIRFAAVMGLATTILSLGSHLVIHNRRTRIPLPWDVLQHLPLANNVIVVRFSLYTMLFAAVIVALGMQELRLRWTMDKRSCSAARPGFGRTRIMHLGSIASVGMLGIASALSLVPAWPFKTTSAGVPAFFSSAEVDRIPYGSVALISPYPSVAEVQAQMWQAIAKMRFRIIGGDALVPTSVGVSSQELPDVLSPAPVQRFLWAKATGGRPYPAGRVPRDDTQLLCEVRSFLLRYQVGTVIWTRHDAQPGVIDALYDGAIGPPSYVGGGATVWFGVRELVQARIRSCTT